MAILYCLSGLTSLAYEVLWARMLSLQFGVSIFGVVLTVAAFMFGLGLGSLVGIKWAKKCKKPLLIFALLETGIALYAMLLPGLLHSVSGWIESIAIHLSLAQWYVLQGTEALCLLVIPAFGMGLGFAPVLKFVVRTPLSMGKLYGLNTMGGAVGALFPLWSLPVLGWLNSVRLIASIGLAVGVAAFILSQTVRTDDEKLSSSVQSDQRSPALLELLIYGGIGASSIMLEIGWVRLYGMIMLRTEYVLGVILAVFLLGIALGSLLLPRIPKLWLAVLMPILAANGVLASMYLLPYASSWIENNQFQSLFGAMWSQAMLLGIFTLPVTLALGAWLPLMANRHSNSESSGVWLYGANCLGGGIGAITACLVCIPWIGSEAMVTLAGIAIAVFGLMWARPRWAWLAIVPMLLLAWPLRSLPPVHDLLPKVESKSRDLYLYEDAVSLTQVVQQQDGQRVLLSDLQRMDASTEPSAVKIQMDQARLALLLHSAPHSVLFLGLGTGISMAGSIPFPDLQRSAVELSQGSIFAARNWFGQVNGNIMNQVQVSRDDARHFLNATAQNYDVIIGDLFHPDLAGMGSLLSVQQFQRARNHLNDGGLFVQWLALNQFDIQSLKVVLRSFQKVFPDAQLFMDGMHLALVGPTKKLSALAMLENLQRLSAREQDLVTGQEGVWTWLGRYWGPISVSNGQMQDEWMPYIEFNLPGARYDGSVNLENLLAWLLRRHPDASEAMKILGINAEEKKQFGRAYVATELVVRAWMSSIQGDAERAGKLIWLAYQENPQDYWIANALADNMFLSLSQAREHGLSEREALQRVLHINPYFVGAIRAIWHLEQSAGNTKAAESYRQRLLAISPLDYEANALR